ncbi:unannotated protein [freshwater metagenome]|uniref:Unannotated protein n=1 Tax=freshwater metagenome TaxID=449393 RepID=A0A6J7VD86_9ZZZZ
MSCTQDIGISGVGLLNAIAIWQLVADQPFGHFFTAAKFADKISIQPWLIDSQIWVSKKAIAIEALNIVAFVGRTIAPNFNVILQHRAHQ